jgi:hypothetical protein
MKRHRHVIRVMTTCSRSRARKSWEIACLAGVGSRRSSSILRIKSASTSASRVPPGRAPHTRRCRSISQDASATPKSSRRRFAASWPGSFESSRFFLGVDFRGGYHRRAAPPAVPPMHQPRQALPAWLRQSPPLSPSPHSSSNAVRPSEGDAGSIPSFGCALATCSASWPASCV